LTGSASRSTRGSTSGSSRDASTRLLWRCRDPWRDPSAPTERSRRSRSWRRTPSVAPASVIQNWKTNALVVVKHYQGAHFGRHLAERVLDEAHAFARHRELRRVRAPRRRQRALFAWTDLHGAVGAAGPRTTSSDRETRSARSYSEELDLVVAKGSGRESRRRLPLRTGTQYEVKGRGVTRIPETPGSGRLPRLRNGLVVEPRSEELGHVPVGELADVFDEPVGRGEPVAVALGPGS